ncbi:MAG TPA: elongation factor P [Candidatus Avidehalobacter gallistercoris]|uniref:Elongation factor P n=1 Tax=Candidatus Avidehalobacter gallistercoris TaxID=2840694 RepID=A0A9D1KZR2_9FIRM|nr:elongation factor P [Candidatus Avidehalobacter gallistercoris]
MISSNDFRNGVSIDLDGEAFVVVDFQHVKPGKGSAFVRTKLKNVRTGGVVERTFAAGEKVPKAHLERKQMQYLYNDGDYVFMDNNTYDQMSLTAEQIGPKLKYLKENMDLYILFFKGAILGVDFPPQVELTVTETEPGIKGDTATGGTKPATTETGAIIKVPFFINEGDVIRVNTETGEYIERV